MKTDRLMLRTYAIETRSLQVSWYDNGQMTRYTEVKDGKWDGDWKHWSVSGEMYWHRVYKKGKVAKEIV